MDFQNLLSNLGKNNSGGGGKLGSLIGIAAKVAPFLSDKKTKKNKKEAYSKEISVLKNKEKDIFNK